MKLRAGDWVEVQSKEAILRTLDKSGRLENTPFMPQMFSYCGKRFKVFKRAHKTCDWVYQTKGRRIFNTVHLDLRCDGEAYGGCQSACLLYWKEAWLVPVTGPGPAFAERTNGDDNHRSTQALDCDSLGCTEHDVWAATRRGDLPEDNEPRFVCQGTEVFNFTQPLAWWDIRQYVEDLRSRNLTVSQLLTGLTYRAYSSVMNLGIGIGRPMRWLYDAFQRLRGGLPCAERPGSIPVGDPTPTTDLGLEQGELVRVRPFNEVLKTLNAAGMNRGMSFDKEMAPYCEQTLTVRTRVTRFVDERTGKLVTLKNPCIILEGATCQSRYSDCRIGCPRNIYPWWHEIWLERASGATSDEAPNG